MSDSKPTLHPYYSKWDTPKLQSRFHRAVFNGRTAKVKDLIASGENVYATTDLDESSLFISIARDHLPIANQILDVYESDLEFVKQIFLQKYGRHWREQEVFVAHGENNICSVNELAVGMEVLQANGSPSDEMQTMVILLKSYNEKSVLWLRPVSGDDNIKIAKIVECIRNDGVIDLKHTGHWGRTVFDVAAIRNHPEIYCRLNTLAPTTVQPDKSIEHFLQMSRHYDDQVDFFKKISHKTKPDLNIGDTISRNIGSLLISPAYYDAFNAFVFFAESLIDTIGSEGSRETEMRNVLDTCKVAGGCSIIESIIWLDCKKFIQRCIEFFKPNLLLMGSNNQIVLQSLIAHTPNEFTTKFVVECYTEILTVAGLEDQIVLQLIGHNWLDAVKILYDRYESSRQVLFRNKKQGVQCLLNAIDGCRYDLADFLIMAHRDDLTDPDDVTQLILYCSFVQRSYGVLQTILALPAADVLRTSGPEHYYKSPIHVALTFRHLVNLQLLLDNVKNPPDLCGLKEDNGENLLFPSIWFKENPVDETPFVYVEEEAVSLEIVDSSDDEDEAAWKNARNEQSLTSTPYQDPIMPDSFFQKQSDEMARLFNYFVNDIGVDYRCVNNSGETLLHVAVKRDNFDAVKKLLELGLDPNAVDGNGNSPMHAVRSTNILNVLLDRNCNVNAANIVGETPLLAYVKTIESKDEHCEVKGAFLVDLLAAGADINHGDVNGLRALHLVKNAKIAEILLERGADINALNNEGETPILYIFREQFGAQGLYKVFLCNESLDLIVLSKNKVSILSVLVSLDEPTMSDVLASLHKHSKISQLDTLFTQHCNSVDHYGSPVLIASCSDQTNRFCLDKLLNVPQLNPNLYPDYQPLEAEHKDTVKRLIERGANVNGCGEGKKKTPLMHAIGGRNLGGYRSNFETFAVLLAAEADVNAMDENGDTALDYAGRLENVKDARRIIAALILASVDYDHHHRQSGEDKSPLSNVHPFQCFYTGG